MFALIMLFALLSLFALSLLKPYFSYDNNKRIAAAILSDSDGQINEHVVTAALNVRFMPNTPLHELVNFVKAQGGRCSDIVNNEVSCSLLESGSFLVVKNMLLIVKLNQDSTINSIAVNHYFTGL